MARVFYSSKPGAWFTSVALSWGACDTPGRPLSSAAGPKSRCTATCGTQCGALQRRRTQLRSCCCVTLVMEMSCVVSNSGKKWGPPGKAAVAFFLFLPTFLILFPLGCLGAVSDNSLKRHTACVSQVHVTSWSMMLPVPLDFPKTAPLNYLWLYFGHIAIYPGKSEVTCSFSRCRHILMPPNTG